MESSLELRGKTGIELNDFANNGSGNGSSAKARLRNSSGRKIKGAIGGIFTSFMRNSEPPGDRRGYVVIWNQNLGSSA